MIRLRHWTALALLLILVGTALTAWKSQVYGYPLTPGNTEDSWTVQARLQIRPGEGPVRVELERPAATPGLGRLREDFISRGFGLDVQEATYRRTVTWAIRRASGLQTLYYRAQYFRDPNQRDFAPRPDYPPVPELEEPFAAALQSITDEVRQRSANIATFTAELLSRLNAASPSAEMQLFLNDSRFQNDRIALARTLLAGARIPTEAINAVLLVDNDRRNEPVQWLAVHNDQQWLYFDPWTGRQHLPDNLLVWWRGERSPLEIDGAELASMEWSVRRNEVGSLSLAQQRARQDRFMFAHVSLLDLPVHTQSVYSVLLLVPIGAFILVLLRNVVGVRAFGTFMPVLIALAFRETGLFGGLILFTLVVAMGLLCRFYLERLHLTLVPRLTAVLTVVVILMVGLSMFSDRIGWEVGLSVGLFPMVILAMVIERMSIIWEERGPRDALLEGAGSALIAVIAYLVMGLALVQYLVVVYPELLLVLLGFTVMLGRYSGYRLTELSRFRDLTIPQRGP
jgi:hypothetical protein